MQFEFLKTQTLSPATNREIEAFLDRQSNSHPFQFPRWTSTLNGDEHEEQYCAIMREQGEMRWFAHGAVVFLAGKRLRFIRGLMIYRGPVCDDADLTLR